jgi:hypothetical protein
MKKILLALLLVTGFVQAERQIDPSDSGPLEPGRLVSQSTNGPVTTVVTDKKTGCQYGFIALAGIGIGSISLGCFPEYVDPKFKK